jgi:gluconolactonase
MKSIFKILTTLLILVVFSFYSQPVKAQLENLIQPGATLEKLSGEFSFTEGPCPDSKGNIYFTDQPNNRIMIWTVDDKLETFLQPAGRANGLFLDKKGNVWACADEKGELWEISKDKKVTVVLKGFEGKPFNGPNDLYIMKNGGIYFTDPFFVRDYWENKEMRQKDQAVYYLKPDHKTVIKINSGLLQPNGIICTPDEKTIYIADMRGRKTYTYTVNKDGSLTDKKQVLEVGSDGLVLDKQGNIYTTGSRDGVTIWDKEGKKLGSIKVPESWIANLCFGGKDNKSLFITASKGLYRMKMQVEGIEK